MVSKKDRKQRGWITPNPTVPIKALIENDLFLDEYYDDWSDHRDGMRDWFSDFKKIKKVHFRCSVWWQESLERRLRMNKKQKYLLQRRKKRLWKG